MPRNITKLKDGAGRDVVMIVLLLAIGLTGVWALLVPGLIYAVLLLGFITAIFMAIRRRNRLKKDQDEELAVIEKLF